MEIPNEQLQALGEARKRFDSAFIAYEKARKEASEKQARNRLILESAIKEADTAKAEREALIAADPNNAGSKEFKALRVRETESRLLAEDLDNASATIEKDATAAEEAVRIAAKEVHNLRRGLLTRLSSDLQSEAIANVINAIHVAARVMAEFEREEAPWLTPADAWKGAAERLFWRALQDGTNAISRGRAPQLPEPYAELLRRGKESAPKWLATETPAKAHKRRIEEAQAENAKAG